MKKSLLLLASCCLLSACVYQSNLPPQSPGDHATAKLAEAATSVSHSLNELARIQAEATPAVKGNHRLPDPAQMGIRQVGSVDWSGPVEPLLQHVAKAMGYKLRVLGRHPKTPIIVTIVAKNQPIGNIIRDVDYQATHKAYIAVYPRNRVIELRYATV